MPRPSTGTGLPSPARRQRAAATVLEASDACPDCKRRCRSRCVGRDGIARNADIAEAIDYAVDHGAAVVNVSLIGPNSPQRLRDAIVRARAAGVLVVAAAGNEGNETPMYPAAFEEATSVAAVTQTGDARLLFESWAVGRLRGARVHARSRARRRLGHRLRHVGVGAADLRDRRADAHPRLRSRHVVDVEGALPTHGIANGAFREPQTGILDAEDALRSLGSPERDFEPVVLGDPVVGARARSVHRDLGRSGTRRSSTSGNVAVAGTARRSRVRRDPASRSPEPTEGIECASTSPWTAARRRRRCRPAAVATAPRLLARPSIAGVPRVGARLVARRGTWAGTSLRYSVTWLRCRLRCTPSGRGTTYVVRAMDRGSRAPGRGDGLERSRPGGRPERTNRRRALSPTTRSRESEPRGPRSARSRPAGPPASADRRSSRETATHRTAPMALMSAMRPPPGSSTSISPTSSPGPSVSDATRRARRGPRPRRRAGARRPAHPPA